MHPTVTLLRWSTSGIKRYKSFLGTDGWLKKILHLLFPLRTPKEGVRRRRDSPFSIRRIIVIRCRWIGLQHTVLFLGTVEDPCQCQTSRNNVSHWRFHQVMLFDYLFPGIHQYLNNPQDSQMFSVTLRSWTRILIGKERVSFNSPLHS